MWLLRRCETVSLASRLRGRLVCVAVAPVDYATVRRSSRRKEDPRTALTRDLRQLRGYYRRVLQPQRRVRLPGRILV